MKYDPEIHHRRSIRLKGYDYTQPGAYFITLVTYQRNEIFGEVVDDEMKLSTLGHIVYDEWMRSIQIRKEIRLYEDEFVVMPNHIHAIVWMVNPIVGADGVRPSDPPSNKIITANPNQTLVVRSRGEIGVIGEGARRAPLRGMSLGAFIAGFKSTVTSRARRELNMTGIWQRNYYEHIIRNETEFKHIWDYIDDNPRKWQEDKLHPSAPPNPPPSSSASGTAAAGAG